MILIADANAVISALMKDGKSREILTYYPFTFYSPDTLLESIEKYKTELIVKSGLSEKEFEGLLSFVLRRVKIVKKEDYESKLEEANEILGDIDVEDVIYIALALSIKNDGVWSNDRHFEEQDRIRIWKTEDIVKEFNEKM